MVVSRRQLILGAFLLLLLALALLFRPATVIRKVVAVLYSPWFPILLVGLYTLRPFLGWPITVLSGLAGFRYGIALGLPIALLGAVATSFIPYLGAHRLAFDGRIGSWFTGGSRRYFQTAGDLRGMIAARLAPTPAEAISAAAGFGGVPLRSFVLGTLVGELPWTIAAVTVGHSVNAFSVRAIAVDWRLLLTGALAAGLLLAGPLYRVTTDRLSVE
ncbi:MAG: TVP38/TMEM64 family protein [Halodesulfurarchaeum sp.]